MGGKVVPPTWQSTHHRESWRHSPGALTACNHCGQLCAGIIRRKAGIPKGSTSAIRWPQGRHRRPCIPAEHLPGLLAMETFPLQSEGAPAASCPFCQWWGRCPEEITWRKCWWRRKMMGVLMKEDLLRLNLSLVLTHPFLLSASATSSYQLWVAQGSSMVSSFSPPRVGRT